MLPDTSAWIQHQLSPDPVLSLLINARRVCGHPLVIGELWLGCGIRPRELAEFVASLPQAPLVDPADVRSFADQARIVCAGVGWVDACLLASCGAAPGGLLVYSKDRALVRNARRLHLCYGQ